MRILPSITMPWGERISRRHSPHPAVGLKGYRSYRGCLRWEFGFSCAFCLCHEADMAAYEAEDSGQTHIEHFIPQSRNPKLRNSYGNCFYICRFCNGARRNARNESPQGWVLLNPCDHAWGEMFFIVNDEIRPRDIASRDVAYTHEVYALNDRRKVRRRKLRRETIDDRVKFLEDTRDDEKLLLDSATVRRDAELVRQAKKTRVMRRLAALDLIRRFRAVPQDRGESCRCGHDKHHTLPTILGEQTFDLRDLLRSSPSPRL